MVGKVWYYWQHKNVFAGATVSWQANPSVVSSSTLLGSLLGSIYIYIFDLRCHRSESANVQQTNSAIPSDGMWNATTVGNVLGDTAGGKLCYVYA